MRRLRFYRVLMPSVLVIFVVVLALQLRPVNVVHTKVPRSDIEVGASGTGITAVDWNGAQKAWEIKAGSVRVDDDGRAWFDDIEELKLFRDGQLPLLIQALAGDITGEKGSRAMTFDKGVTLDDPEKGLRVELPELAYDESRSEAYSEREMHLEGSGLAGSARTLVYRLDDRPAELTDLRLEDDTGATLRADRAVLHDGLDDVELLDHVRLERDDEFLDSPRLRVRRDKKGRLEWATADGGVRAAIRGNLTDLWAVSGEAVELRFDPDGDARTIDLDGQARIDRQAESLAAERIRGQRDDTYGMWNLAAEGTVVLEAGIQGSPGFLRAQTVTAKLDGNVGVRSARANGRVSFDGANTRAEAEHATYEAGVDGEVRLFGDPRRKARLARDRTRVAALEVALSLDGRTLTAEREVEASLLPGATAGSRLGPFRTEEAIHFVSRDLTGREGGRVLVFDGDARGWQGERNLAATRITLDQDARILVAEENVSARMPRVAGDAAAQSDYIQVSAERLEYAEKSGEGVFRDAVRVTIVEGWLEGDEIRVRMSAEGGIAEVLGSGNLRLEFRDASEPTGSPKVVAGTADRIVYRPDEQTVWLIGDDAPASVRQVGQEKGTTTGRVLRYQLRTGALEVDSGDGGPATIRTVG